MSETVLNSSIALTWCFEDEATSETDALFERVRDEGAIVPGLWHLELGNVLLQAEKRGRIGANDIAARLDLIAELPISVDQETTVRAWRETLATARGERLAVYDASLPRTRRASTFAAYDIRRRPRCGRISPRGRRASRAEEPVSRPLRGGRSTHNRRPVPRNALGKMLGERADTAQAARILVGDEPIGAHGAPLGQHGHEIVEAAGDEVVHDA